MAGALIAKTGGAMLIAPIVNRIIDAYTESKRLDFELAKVREQGAVARRALKLKERELECDYKSQIRRIESAERALDGALEQLRENARQSSCDRESLRRDAARLMKAIVSDTVSVEQMRLMMACYNDIQGHLRVSAADSLKSLQLGFSTCNRYVSQIGYSAGEHKAVSYDGASVIELENKEEV